MDREKRKEYPKAIIIKEKKLLHYLINRVEEIENVCISG